mmetsp:Transcript_126805/g.248547  ORF Transcript_126805/g.248547 Transcript_126805/m.248547 type:complete len:112 (+) Transcript_126805:277-612(+)
MLRGPSVSASSSAACTKILEPSTSRSKRAFELAMHRNCSITRIKWVWESFSLAGGGIGISQLHFPSPDVPPASDVVECGINEEEEATTDGGRASLTGKHRAIRSEGQASKS